MVESCICVFNVDLVFKEELNLMLACRTTLSGDLIKQSIVKQSGLNNVNTISNVNATMYLSTTTNYELRTRWNSNPGLQGARNDVPPSPNKTCFFRFQNLSKNEKKKYSLLKEVTSMVSKSTQKAQIAKVGTTSLDRLTFDQSTFGRGRLWLDYNFRSIWYHGIHYLDQPVFEIIKRIYHYINTLNLSLIDKIYS